MILNKWVHSFVCVCTCAFNRPRVVLCYHASQVNLLLILAILSVVGATLLAVLNRFFLKESGWSKRWILIETGCWKDAEVFKSFCYIYALGHREYLICLSSKKIKPICVAYGNWNVSEKNVCIYTYTGKKSQMGWEKCTVCLACIILPCNKTGESNGMLWWCSASRTSINSIQTQNYSWLLNSKAAQILSKLKLVVKISMS